MASNRSATKYGAHFYLPVPAGLPREEGLHFVGHPGTVDDVGAKRNGFVEGQ